ncbi:hypothetical protein RB594_006272 [Gaeumannomyces avenae]
MFPNMFPPPPSAQVEWDLHNSARHVEVNGHIEARYDTSRGQWAEPRLVSSGNTASTGGQHCGETMVALRHVTPWGDKLVVFRPDFHAARMARSAAASTGLPPPPLGLFTECVRRAVAANAEFVPPAESEGMLSIRAVLAGASAEHAVLSVHVHPAVHSFDAAPQDALLSESDGVVRLQFCEAAAAAAPYSDDRPAHELLGLRPDNTLVMAESAAAHPVASALARLAERGGFRVERCPAAELALALPLLAEAVAVGDDGVVPVRRVDGAALPDADATGLMGIAQHLLGVVRGVRGDGEGWCAEVRPTDDEVTALVEKEEERLAAPAGPLLGGLWAVGSAVNGLCPGGLFGMLGLFSPGPCVAREC